MKIALAICLLSSAAYADISLPSANDAAERGRAAAGTPSACPRIPARDIVCRGHHCDVARRAVDYCLAHMTELATCARIVPSIHDGHALGFKLYAIRPGSLYTRLLMRNGDRIQTINGIDLSSPDKALETYARLRSSDHLVVELDRRGEQLTLDYSIR